MLPKPTETAIFITSNEPWGDVWFSKQHYANELAMLGYTVYFLNAPTHWSPKHFFDNSLKIKNIKQNLSVVNYVNPYPLRFAKPMFARWNDQRNYKKLLALVGDKKQVIWWKFDPFRFASRTIFNTQNTKHIYHVVDPYQHVDTDKLLAQTADLLVLVSDYYTSFYQAFKQKTCYAPHGVSQSEMQVNTAILAQIKAELGEGYIVYVGTLNKDIDVTLLQAIANAIDRPLVLIGPNNLDSEGLQLFAQLQQHPRVHYLGSKPANQLKEYVALASVGIVPYKNKMSQNVHRTPLKIINYLSQNKPTVSTINYELKELDEKAIFVRASPADFITQLNTLLQQNNNNDIIATAQHYLQGVQYPILIKNILEHLYTNK